ncbi:MAG: hypothetical protein GF334_02635 [Candidatus Altiarchaeales archaeon]|nr:hypothetical protein [Candidatus Altiarchaeales archaeon]
MDQNKILQKIPVWELIVLLGAAATLFVLIIVWILFGYSWEITQVKPPTMEINSLMKLIQN